MSTWFQQRKCYISRAGAETDHPWDNNCDHSITMWQLQLPERALQKEVL